MSVSLSLFAGAGQQFFTNNGIPLAGGLLYSYTAGTTTPQACYTSLSGSIAQTNPIVLDSAGRVPNEIWLTDGSAYKFVLATSTNVVIGTYDNIVSQATFAGSIAVAGDVTVGGNLSVTGNETVTGNLTVGGTLTATITGRVRQVVSVSTTTVFTTTSGTYVSTGHTASITPSSTSSKILVLLSSTLAQASTNFNTNLTISRNGSTNLAGGGNASFADTLSSAGNIYAPVSVVYYDSPSATTAQSYRVDILASGGTAIYNSPGSYSPTNTANLILMEIL